MSKDPNPPGGAEASIKFLLGCLVVAVVATCLLMAWKGAK